MSQPGEITQLLQEADQGRPEAANELFTLVEDDLRAIVHKRRAATADAELSTTVLVHDAFLRLVGQRETVWQPGDRRKFFGYFARKVQDLLVQDLRARAAQKRGGQHRRADGSEELEHLGEPTGADPDLLLDLKDALDRFEQFAPDEALVFRLRCYLGCTFEEVAEVVSVSLAEAKRSYQRAKLWLQRELESYEPHS
jgi:RNA polymerase sigma factor (TIGR02999 family)